MAETRFGIFNPPQALETLWPIKEIEEDLAIVQRKFDILNAERKRCLIDYSWVTVAANSFFTTTESSVKFERARSIGAAAAKEFYSLAETTSLTLVDVKDHRNKLERNEIQMVQNILNYNASANRLLQAHVSVTEHSRIRELQVQYASTRNDRRNLVKEFENLYTKHNYFFNFNITIAKQATDMLYKYLVDNGLEGFARYGNGQAVRHTNSQGDARENNEDSGATKSECSPTPVESIEHDVQEEYLNPQGDLQDQQSGDQWAVKVEKQ